MTQPKVPLVCREAADFELVVAAGAPGVEAEATLPAEVAVPAEVAAPEPEAPEVKLPAVEATDALGPNVHDAASVAVAGFSVGFPLEGPFGPLTPVYEANVMVVVKLGRFITVAEADTPRAVTEPARLVSVALGHDEGKESGSRYSLAPNGGLP